MDLAKTQLVCHQRTQPSLMINKFGQYAPSTLNLSTDQLILKVEHQNISYYFRETIAPTCALMQHAFVMPFLLACTNHNLLKPLSVENMVNIRVKAN